MKPLCHVFEEIISVDNLFRAAEATLARGRRFRGEGARYKLNLEREVLALHRRLISGNYRHGRYRLFTVLDPKVRVIAAANVRDRVVHHAVHDVIEPRLDSMFNYDSYACRHGKGAHRALDRAHGFLRANIYGLHLDVKSYFQCIDHEILKGLLRRYIADERAMGLVAMIVDSTDYLARAGMAGGNVSSFAPVEKQLELFDSRAGEAVGGAEGRRSGGRIRGLPLGNLTSQFFANLYLNELDRFVKHELKAKYYVRYMDDMLLFAEEKVKLAQWEQAIGDFARKKLRLELHPSGGPRPVRRGLMFLGFRLFPGYRKLRKTSVTRFIRRMNGYTREYFALGPDRESKAALLSLIRQSTMSFHAHALHGDTYRIRQRLYNRFPIVNQYALAGMKGPRLNLRATRRRMSFRGGRACCAPGAPFPNPAGDTPSLPTKSVGGGFPCQHL